MINELMVVADGFSYPGPDSLEHLTAEIETLDGGPVRTALGRFATSLGRLQLGEWEELHTRTVDLSPLFVPYVGHVAWGENYRRGAFMADLQRAMFGAGVDKGGELPDHLAPILRLLAVGGDLPDDLIEALPPAVASMRKDLKKAEPDNPYRYLLAAAEAAVTAHLPQGASA